MFCCAKSSIRVFSLFLRLLSVRLVVGETSYSSQVNYTVIFIFAPPCYLLHASVFYVQVIIVKTMTA